MANRRLKLTRYGVQNVDFLWVGAYRLRVEAADSLNTGADPNVFLYNRALPDPETDEVVDTFLGVCSPADIAEYPIGEPITDTPYPFYRAAFVEIDVRAVGTPEEEEDENIEETERRPTAATCWKLIQEGVNHLLLSLDTLENLVELEVVYVGEPPATDDDSGGSDSTSS